MADSRSLVGARGTIDNFLLIGGGHPVIIGRDNRVIAHRIRMMQLQRRIGQCTVDTLRGQRRTKRPHDYFLRVRPGNNETANQDVVAALDITTGRDISQSRDDGGCRWGG